MSALETLISILSSLGPELHIRGGDDVDVRDIDENTDVTVKTGDTEHTYDFSNSIVVLNPDLLTGETYRDFQRFVRENKEEEGRLTRVDKSGAVKALEGTDRIAIDEVMRTFSGVISPRHERILRSALFLREVTANDADSEIDVHEVKRQISERHGYEAYYISHLVSSGYFDEGRYFQNLYEEMEVEYDNTSRRYRDEFETIIGEKLIAVFVNSEDTIFGVVSDVKSTLMKHFRFRPPADFVDVCGLGWRCRGTIDDTLAELTDEYVSIRHEDRDRGEERVVRIYPESVSRL